jgi:MurNAc alpha-1-phosphate uridylyltransferase
MKINTALILCAGFGKRLNPLTLDNPKPLLKINNNTLLEECIKLVKALGVKKIIINTFYLREKITNFLKVKNFDLDIEVIDDGEVILNTGGGILNMINSSNDNDFLVFNPDTFWNLNYLYQIKEMEKFYFSKKIKNILLVVNKDLSFDKSLKGDFNLTDYYLAKKDVNNFIYTGCQIINKNLFKKYQVRNFSITEIWDKLLKENKLFGYESKKNFHHLTNLAIYRKLLED